jgi:hypothetical protein
VNKAILKAALEKAQDELIQELCGPKYSRGEPRNYRRAGTTRRTLVTRHGTIELRLVKVRSLENCAILRPLLLYIGVEPRKRIVDDLIMECAETATYLTYRDSKTIIEDLTKARVSKHRIHSSVQTVGAYMGEERGKKAKEKVDLMISDGTKAHGVGKKNEINVVLGKDLETGEKSLLGLTVNRSWGETAGQVTATADVLISDADRAMRNALIEKALSHQLCENHAVREVNRHLWSVGLPKQERKLIRGRLRAVLRTLRNSARKHLVDGDLNRLLEAKGIEPVVKPRRNSRLDAGPPSRRRAVDQVRRLGYDGWARLTGYGRRWAVETSYSTFKRLFGAHISVH